MATRTPSRSRSVPAQTGKIEQTAIPRGRSFSEGGPAGQMAVASKEKTAKPEEEHKEQGHRSSSLDPSPQCTQPAPEPASPSESPLCSSAPHLSFPPAPDVPYLPHSVRMDKVNGSCAHRSTHERKTSVEEPLLISSNYVLTGHFNITAKQFTLLKRLKEHWQDVEAHPSTTRFSQPCQFFPVSSCVGDSQYFNK